MDYTASVRLTADSLELSCVGPSGQRFTASGVDMATAKANLAATLTAAETRLTEIRATSKKHPNNAKQTVNTTTVST